MISYRKLAGVELVVLRHADTTGLPRKSSSSLMVSSHHGLGAVIELFILDRFMGARELVARLSSVFKCAMKP